MNQMPWGYPDPTYQPPQQPQRPSPAAVEAQTGLYVVTGGLVATLAALALVAWKAGRAEDRAVQASAGLVSYMTHHAIRHAQLDAHLAALEATNAAEHAALWSAIEPKTVYQAPMSAAFAPSAVEELLPVSTLVPSRSVSGRLSSAHLRSLRPTLIVDDISATPRTRFA